MTTRRCFTRLWYLLMRADLDGIRFFLALSSLLWGLLLLAPGETFERSTYTIMAKMADEWVWAAAHLVHGFAALASLFGVTIRRISFTLGPLLGAFLWTFSSIAMMAAVHPLPAAIAPHLVGSVAAWWLLVRHKD